MCLFALDMHAAIPVDTHVWQLAVRYYTPHLKGVPMWQHREAQFVASLCRGTDRRRGKKILSPDLDNISVSAKDWHEMVENSASFPADFNTCLL